MELNLGVTLEQLEADWIVFYKDGKPILLIDDDDFEPLTKEQELLIKWNAGPRHCLDLPDILYDDGVLLKEWVLEKAQNIVIYDASRKTSTFESYKIYFLSKEDMVAFKLEFC